MKNAKTSVYRAALKAGSASLVLGIALTATSAFAQDTAQTPSVTPSGQGTVAAEEIVVTGSRIARPNLEGASPVTVINNAEIKLQGTTRVEDLVNNLPQAFAQQGGNVSNGASGTATVNLRNLGASRTLVLINGRRLVPGDPLTPVADLNAIPASLVERVDVLTGGASSVYGADAVAGVVNFIMDTDFEGFRIDTQYSFYQHNNSGDERVRDAIRASQAGNPGAFPLPDGNTTGGGTFDVSATFGAGFDDGRGHLTAYAGYRKIKPVLQANYDYSACALSASTEDDSFSCGGSSTTAPTRIQAFTDSTLEDRFANVIVDSSGLAFRPFSSTRDLYNFAPANFYQRPDERYTAGTFANYEVNDHFKPYLEFSFMDDRTKAQIAPSGVFGVAGQIGCDNPLLTAAQRATLCPNPGQTVVDVVVQRRNVEGGGRVADLRHTNYRFVLGTKGDITENWSYDLYGQFGRTVFQQVYFNDFSNARIARALDVVSDPDTGAPVCRSVLDGTDPNCVPYNLFRGTGITNNVLNGVTPEALAYLQTPGFQRGDTTEQIVSGSISGDFGDGFSSPWADENIGIAIGAEYRKESLNLDVDEAFRTGDLAGQGGPTLPNQGGYDVREVFGELRIPIAQDMPFFDSLVVEAGYRYSKYKTNSETAPDNSFSTDTYKVAVDWAPIDMLRLRAGYNRAVRAPNVVELYTAQGLGLFAGVDPCGGETPIFTLEQCQRTGVTPDQYGAIELNAAAQYNALLSGTPSLEPETADTWTAGFVFAPRSGALSGFSLTVDYFDIKVDNFIVVGGFPQVYLRACGITGAAEFCDRIQRDPGTGSLFLLNSGFVVAENVNTGSQRTRGVDVAADYRFDLGDVGLGDAGGLSFNFVGTYLDKLETDTGIAFNAAGDTSFDCVGLYGVTCGVPSPKWRHKLRVTYSAPSIFSVSANWRYVGKVRDEQSTDNDVLKIATYPANDKLKAENYIDLAVSADVTENATIRFGVNNVFDNDPPVIGQASLSGTFGNGNTYPQIYDALGRYLYIGGSFSF